MAVVDPSLLIANCGLSEATVRGRGGCGGRVQYERLGLWLKLVRVGLVCCLMRCGAAWSEGCLAAEQSNAHLACKANNQAKPACAALTLTDPTVQVRALEARGITSLFPIQKTVFEPAMAGHDLIARAKTGSGARPETLHLHCWLGLGCGMARKQGPRPHCTCQDRQRCAAPWGPVRECGQHVGLLAHVHVTVPSAHTLNPGRAPGAGEQQKGGPRTLKPTPRFCRQDAGVCHPRD